MLNPRQQALVRLIRDPKRMAKNASWRLRSRPSNQSHIFVIGPPRSGTTLLQTLLGAHPNLATSDSETGIFTYQDLFLEGRRYAGLTEAEVRGLLEACHTQVELFDAMASHVVESKGAKRFVEKTPQHARELKRLLRLFPRARFLFLYRDGRDCFCSAGSNNRIWQVNEDPTAFAKYWANIVRHRLRVASERIMDLSYESLTSDPEATLRSAMAFVGEVFHATQLDPGMRSKDRRSQTTAFAKLGFPVTADGQQRWKRELTKEQVDRFESAAGRELSALGYSTGRELGSG